ncbi:hypothetical protein D1R32_gp153 [Tunisvirus fontaine2]|uniref:Uncharacterized protein n=1 Tax=Tunisvirus fontaine2 TaxID=1421067 RepID=V9SDR7_9VIRU|nr:hypothetical protein D1R32_gp153 [Tunisvirus fontaine2]AHC54870.1 hypothetical protein TNS_ORF152 [Tunisvirus fontaine2]
MNDYDSVGYWLKGIPYIWVPGESLKESKRYYFSNPKVVLFSEDNKTARQGVWMRTSETTGGEEVLEYSLSFFPCQDWPRNFFLVVPFKPDSWRVENSKLFMKPVSSWIPEQEWWGTKGMKFEIKIEGEPLKMRPFTPEYRESVGVMLPNKELKKMSLAPPELFDVFSYPVLGVSTNVVGVSSKKTGKDFWNIVQLASFLKLPTNERKTLHKECLGEKKTKRHDFLYDFLEKPERERERGKVCAEWYNDAWANKFLWGGPIYSDTELLEHEPYQLDIA